MLRTGRYYAYSQNRIRSKELVRRLLDKSCISYADTVLEIGTGKAIITIELAKICKNVISYEIDPFLYAYSLNAITQADNVKLINADFLTATLPCDEYKIVSNIPFNLTSRIIHKLLRSNNPPTLAYLIVQKEAAEKLIGYPRETQLSLLLKPFFDIRIIEELKRTDFEPTPSVDTVFVKIEKLTQPSLLKESALEYFNFIVYATTQWKPTIKAALKQLLTWKQINRLSSDLGFDSHAAPLDISFNQWSGIYNYFNDSVSQNKKGLIKNSYVRQLARQEKLKKSYHTR